MSDLNSWSLKILRLPELAFVGLNANQIGSVYRVTNVIRVPILGMSIGTRIGTLLIGIVCNFLVG